jgi:hypothetical protein
LLVSCNDDKVSTGVDVEAGVVVCLDPTLNRDQARDLVQDRFLRGKFGDPVIEGFASQAASRAFTFGWGVEASAQHDALLAELEAQLEVVAVGENTTVNALCS